MNCLVFRLRGVRVPRAFHDGDVGEDVRSGSAHLLRVGVQSVRLCRHQRVHIRGGLVLSQGRVFWSVRAKGPTVTEDIQSECVFFALPNLIMYYGNVPAGSLASRIP